jgi:hypothetical protein
VFWKTEGLNTRPSDIKKQRKTPISRLSERKFTTNGCWLKWFGRVVWRRMRVSPTGNFSGYERRPRAAFLISFRTHLPDSFVPRYAFRLRQDLCT